MFVVGMLGGLLLVPGGMASDRWGRRATMIAGGVISAAGFAVYAVAGAFGAVVIGVVLRVVGASLLWPAATAWISESSPRRSHALAMGLFGEFENVGVTLGPLLGGLAWSLAGIQAAFITYAAASLLAALVAALSIGRRSTGPLSGALESFGAAQAEAQAPVEGDVRDPGQASSEPSGRL
jgi:MFS family permease